MFNLKKIIACERLSFIVLFLIVSLSNSARTQVANTLSVDVCVYGGPSAGVIAAYTAAKMGKKVILVEAGKPLGGMTSGGLGYTDIDNKYVVTGLARDFYRRVGAHYGKFEQWIFEPKVAEAIFNDYAKRRRFGVLTDRNNRCD